MMPPFGSISTPSSCVTISDCQITLRVRMSSGISAIWPLSRSNETTIQRLPAESQVMPFG